jgi:hypothetical protein
VLCTRAVTLRLPYSAISPLASLADAIKSAKPDLIIPTDDRAVAHLHELHAKCVQGGSVEPGVLELIEFSLGAPENYSNIRSRSRILAIAKEEEILVPDSMPIDCARDLERWQAHHKFPWVLKSDGSCGGTGVKIVSSLGDARRACRKLTSSPTLIRAAQRLIINRDSFPTRTWFKRERPGLTIQDYVPGVPANCSVTCRKGEVLAAFSVEVCTSVNATGAASVVRLIDNPVMLRAAERLVRRLGISGLCGLDFVIEEETGDPYLIELNPRATQLCHLPLGPGRDLIAALFAGLLGTPLPESPPITTADTIAIFPHAWMQNPGNESISSRYNDVPWDEPDLVYELLKTPWPERRPLHMMLKRFRRYLNLRGAEPNPYSVRTAGPARTGRPVKNGVDPAAIK